MRSSSEDRPATGSDSPVPRLSKRIRRQKLASRRINAVVSGIVHHKSTCEMKPGTIARSIGPSPTT